MSLDEGNEAWRAHLLFAFDEHFDIDVEVVAQGLQCTGVDGDAAAVIGGATAVEAAVDFGGHERVGVPLGRVRNRLHVVMGIEQHGGGVRRNDMRADDLPCARSAVGIGSLNHLGIHTHEAQFVCSAVMPLAEIDCSATFSASTLTMRFQSVSTRERISSAVSVVMMVLLYIYV